MRKLDIKRLRLWNSRCTKCPKCEWIYESHVEDWKWHEANCAYMADLKRRIRDFRETEIRLRKRDDMGLYK